MNLDTKNPYQPPGTAGVPTAPQPWRIWRLFSLTLTSFRRSPGMALFAVGLPHTICRVPFQLLRREGLISQVAEFTLTALAFAVALGDLLRASLDLASSSKSGVAVILRYVRFFPAFLVSALPWLLTLAVPIVLSSGAALSDGQVEEQSTPLVQIAKLVLHSMLLLVTLLAFAHYVLAAFSVVDGFTLRDAALQSWQRVRAAGFRLTALVALSAVASSGPVVAIRVFRPTDDVLAAAVSVLFSPIAYLWWAHLYRATNPEPPQSPS